MVELQFTVYQLPHLVSAALTGTLTVYALRKARTERRPTTVLAFATIVGFTTIWAVARFGELLFVDETLTQLWIAILYVGLGVGAPAVLFFALSFTGREQLLTPRTIALALFVPTVAFFLAATNELHHLLWTGDFVTVEGPLAQSVSVYEREFQLPFFLYLGYIQLTFLSGVYLLLRMAVNSADIYRRQTVAFVFGAVVPVSIGTLYTFDQVPLAPPYFDPTPLGYAVASLAFGYAIFRHDMLDLVPIARNTVIESMRDGYVVLDTDGRIVDHNDAAQEVIGEKTGIVGESVDSVLPEIAPVLAAHEHGGRSEEELEIAAGNERRFLLANLTSLTRNERAIGRLLLLRDVTERRAAQRRFRALIENSSDLILVVDPDGTITYVSPSIQGIMGAAPDAIEGMDCFDLIASADRDEVRETFDTVAEEPGAKTRTEYRTEDADGNERVVEAAVTNMLDDPFIEGIVINARDITERKRREEELAATNEELEAANERLDQFASVISHDLRNPINVAKGHVDLARELDDETHYQKVEQSLERMEAIVDDVLTLARQGDSISETQSVALGETAREGWGHVQTEAASLVVADEESFQSDPGRLLQLFENLFRNAIEHGGNDVTVTVGVEGNTLYVEDDGPGIPEDQREDVLESGYTTNDGGTGLGLSIVSQIARAHGWSVAVTEGSDGGARFEFEGIERGVAVETD